jgi:chemotaxis protein histidine kinase CheA
MIMIITPGADRNGVQNLLNVNSKYKAFNKKDDNSGSSQNVKNSNAASFIVDSIMSSSLPLSERITQLQNDISNNQTRQNGLSDISSALHTLKGAVDTGSSKDIEGALASIEKAVEAAVYEDKSLLEDFSLENLKLTNSDGTVNMESLEKASAKADTQQKEVVSGLKSAEHELRGLEISRQNSFSAAALVRDSNFANELLSMTSSQLSDAQSQMQGFGNLNFQSVMELLK